MRTLVLVTLVGCLFLSPPSLANLVDNFEDGDTTNNPTWVVTVPIGLHFVALDPVRPGNHVLQSCGSPTGHRGMNTAVTCNWQGFGFEVEYMASNTNNYGPAFAVGSDTYMLGTRFPIADSTQSANGRWYIADNVGFSPEWWSRDPNAPAFVIPSGEWLRFQIWHDPVGGLIHGRIVRVADDVVLAARTYSPSLPIPTGQITSFSIGIEETDWQYVDNVRLVPEPAALSLLALGGLMSFRHCRRSF